MVLTLIVLIPVGFLVTMSLVAAVLGTSMNSDANTRFEGSELLDIA